MKVYREGNILDGAKPGCVECERSGPFYCDDCSRGIFDKMKTPDGKITCPKDPFTGKYVSVTIVTRYNPNGVSRVVEFRAVYEADLEPLDAIDVVLSETDL